MLFFSIGTGFDERNTRENELQLQPHRAPTFSSLRLYPDITAFFKTSTFTLTSSSFRTQAGRSPSRLGPGEPPVVLLRQTNKPESNPLTFPGLEKLLTDCIYFHIALYFAAGRFRAFFLVSSHLHNCAHVKQQLPDTSIVHKKEFIQNDLGVLLA